MEPRVEQPEDGGLWVSEQAVVEYPLAELEVRVVGVHADELHDEQVVLAEEDVGVAPTDVVALAQPGQLAEASILRTHRTWTLSTPTLCHIQYVLYPIAVEANHLRHLEDARRHQRDEDVEHAGAEADAAFEIGRVAGSRPVPSRQRLPALSGQWRTNQLSLKLATSGRKYQD